MTPEAAGTAAPAGGAPGETADKPLVAAAGLGIAAVPVAPPGIAEAAPGTAGVPAPVPGIAGLIVPTPGTFTDSPEDGAAGGFAAVGGICAKAIDAKNGREAIVKMTAFDIIATSS